MSKKLYLNWLVKGILFGTLGLVFIAAVPSQSGFTSEIPQSITACIPTMQVAKVEPVTAIQKASTIYYLINAYESEDPQPSELLIAVNRQKCSLLLYNPMNDVIPLSRFVPTDVARQFALDKLQIAITEAGGKEQFQQKLLTESRQIGVTDWTPEDLWALQQLGIRAPHNIKVITPESVKVSP